MDGPAPLLDGPVVRTAVRRWVLAGKTRVVVQTLGEFRGDADDVPVVGHLSRLVGVEADRLLGPEGGAAPLLEWALDRGAAAACAEGQGEIQELFDRTVEYLKQRQQFGVPIGTFQALQHRAADMYAELELCRSTMILAAIQADAEDAEQRKADVSAAKLTVSTVGWFRQKYSIQLVGSHAITDEQDGGSFFKRLGVLQGLFGDAAHHVNRYQELARFDAQE